MNEVSDFYVVVLVQKTGVGTWLFAAQSLGHSKDVSDATRRGEAGGLFDIEVELLSGGQFICRWKSRSNGWTGDASKGMDVIVTFEDGLNARTHLATPIIQRGQQARPESFQAQLPQGSSEPRNVRFDLFGQWGSPS